MIVPTVAEKVIAARAAQTILKSLFHENPKAAF